MSYTYTAPSVDASGQTFADLRSKGLGLFMQGLADAQSPAMSPAAIQYLHKLDQINQAFLPMQRAKALVDNFLGGKPVDVQATLDAIFDLQYAYAAVHKTLGEIGVLIAANPGGLQFEPNLLVGQEVRTFP